jgi:hypothetical protein
MVDSHLKASPDPGYGVFGSLVAWGSACMWPKSGIWTNLVRVRDFVKPVLVADAYNPQEVKIRGS